MSADSDYDRYWAQDWAAEKLRRLPPERPFKLEMTWAQILGMNLEIAGGLAHSQDLGMQAGVDLGVALTLQKVRERAAQDAIDAAKEKSPLLTSSQLWLPGFESNKPNKGGR